MPLLMDADVPQEGGFRFFYLLPWDERRLLVEETLYADDRRSTRHARAAAIEAYARGRGWRIASVEREERGALPIPLAGDVDALWSALPPGVAASGMRAALFHPTTGYSLPDAVRVADALAATALARRAGGRGRAAGPVARVVAPPALPAPAEPHAVRGGAPGAPIPRALPLLPARTRGLIERFYAGRLTLADRVRLLVGRPPVPVSRALRCVRETTAGRLAPAAAGPGTEVTPVTAKAAVIGSGFGGLALALRLQSAGVATTLLERRDKPGGRALRLRGPGLRVRRRADGDHGPALPRGAVRALRPPHRGLRRRCCPVRPFYRLFWEDGDVFDYSNDVADTERQIAARCPADVDGYRRFVRYTGEVFQEGYVRLAHVPFLDFASMVRVAPQLVRLQAYRSVYSTVSRFISHPHLREAFSFHSLLVGGNPFATSSIYTLIHHLEREWGVYFPRGGTGALVRALVKLFERARRHAPPRLRRARRSRRAAAA